MSAIAAHIRAGALVQQAAAMLGISERDILNSRDPLSYEARCGIIKTLRENGYSLPQIGRILNRHHTSIMDAERRADDLMGNSYFAGFVEALRG